MILYNAARWAAKVRHEYEKRWGSTFSVLRDSPECRIGELMVIISKATQEIEHIAHGSSEGWKHDNTAMRFTQDDVYTILTVFARRQDPYYKETP